MSPHFDFLPTGHITYKSYHEHSATSYNMEPKLSAEWHTVREYLTHMHTVLLMPKSSL